MDYFDAYLRYWEQYHVYIATTGLTANRDLRVVAYGKQRMEKLAASFHNRYESGLTPSDFKADKTLRERHPDWMERAQPSIERVSRTWAQMGIDFPLDQVLEGW